MKKRQIPFLAMGGLYQEDDLDAVIKVIKEAVDCRGSFFPLPEENDFQQLFARHQGAKKTIAVNSCGTALDCCMMALGIGNGDEVITTPFSFVCTAGTAVARGAKVVFADIHPETLNLDPEKVKEKITERTKAIIPVHFAGLSCDIDAFDEISKKTGIPIIYDAAHAVGAKYKNLPVGGRGKASCYSFQGNKNMTCLGEGGAVTTDDEQFAEKVRQLKTFGYVYGEKLRIVRIGFNYRMTKVQLAAGITQIKKIDIVNGLKRERMQKLNELLKNVEEIILPPGIDENHACHLYVIRVNTDVLQINADSFAAYLKGNYGVQTAKHYPPIWEWEAFSTLGYDGSDCPVAAKVASQVLSLPVFPGTAYEDLEYIAWSIKQTIHELKNRR
ncbi:MAG: DegT/DnrJ/EryC1/StrS family aminotransferase [Candidatus Omnitrophica bacterium]|nr:DegT/DnrJ/EryC1/StrS family aminotransferase [Candidatus Omnitrophota bacterium]